MAEEWHNLGSMLIFVQFLANYLGMKINSVLMSTINHQESLSVFTHFACIYKGFLSSASWGEVTQEMAILSRSSWFFNTFFAEADNVPSELRKSFTWAAFVCFADKGNRVVYKLQYLCFISPKKRM